MANFRLHYLFDSLAAAFFAASFVFASASPACAAVPILTVDLEYPDADEASFVDESAIADSLGSIISYCQLAINVLLGIGLIVSVFAFVKAAFQLASNFSPRAREEAIRNLVTICAVTAALGAFPLFLNLAVSMIVG